MTNDSKSCSKTSEPNHWSEWTENHWIDIIIDGKIFTDFIRLNFLNLFLFAEMWIHFYSNQKPSAIEIPFYFIGDQWPESSNINIIIIIYAFATWNIP